VAVGAIIKLNIAMLNNYHTALTGRTYHGRHTS